MRIVSSPSLRLLEARIESDEPFVEDDERPDEVMEGSERFSRGPARSSERSTKASRGPMRSWKAR
jgi:hypothetical protein